MEKKLWRRHTHTLLSRSCACAYLVDFSAQPKRLSKVSFQDQNRAWTHAYKDPSYFVSVANILHLPFLKLMKINFQHPRYQVTHQFYVVNSCWLPICVISAISCDITLKLSSFSLKITKKGKVVIHRFHVLRKWWEVKSQSPSIHVNFVHDPSVLKTIKFANSCSWQHWFRCSLLPPLLLRLRLRKRPSRGYVRTRPSLTGKGASTALTAAAAATAATHQLLQKAQPLVRKRAWSSGAQCSETSTTSVVLCSIADRPLFGVKTTFEDQRPKISFEWVNSVFLEGITKNGGLCLRRWEDFERNQKWWKWAIFDKISRRSILPFLVS